MKILALIIILTTLACSCLKKTEISKPDITKEDMEMEAKRYESLAKEMCDCSKDLIDILKEIQGMEDGDKEERHKELKKKFEEEVEESEVCIQKLKKKNSKEEEMDEVLMENALKEYCDDFYNMLKVGRIN